MLPTDPALLATIHRLYDDACAGVLATYARAAGVAALEPVTGGLAAHAYVSAVRAAGDGVRVLSLVDADHDALVDIHPLGREHAGLLDTADWCREFNNQLVGRLKNRLLEVGCCLTSGVPALVARHELTELTDPGMAVRTRYVASGGGIALTLATWLRPGLAIVPPSPPPDRGVMHAGLVLF